MAEYKVVIEFEFTHPRERFRDYWAHNCLPDETWKLIEQGSGEVVETLPDSANASLKEEMEYEN